MALAPYDRDNVSLSPEEIADYLDGAIRYWRNEYVVAESTDHKLMACHYIDAFQSVRVSLLGECLLWELGHEQN